VSEKGEVDILNMPRDYEMEFNFTELNIITVEMKKRAEKLRRKAKLDELAGNTESAKKRLRFARYAQHVSDRVFEVLNADMEARGMMGFPKPDKH
jgi:hypothetical protein